MSPTIKLYLLAALLAFAANGVNDVLGQPSSLNSPADINGQPKINLSDTPIDAEIQGNVYSNGLLGDPSLDRHLPSIDEPKTQLSKKLFYSKALSGNRDTALTLGRAG